jgi:hypothetical protein
MTLPDPRHSRTDYGYHSGPDIETDMLNDIVGGSLPRMPGASATEQAMHDDLMREFVDATLRVSSLGGIPSPGRAPPVSGIPDSHMSNQTRAFFRQFFS